MIDILRPILKKLYDFFGDKYEIYTENVEQGVKLPCFFVRIIESNLEPQLGNLYYLRNFISITFMNSDNDLYELEKVRFKMLMALKDIKTSFGIEARNLQAKIKENDVILTCRYDLLFEESLEDVPLMEVLEKEYLVREGENNG